MQTIKLNLNRRGPFCILFSIALMCILVVNGCTTNQAEQLKPLRVGLNSWPGFDVALYAQEAGLFEQRGLDVEFVRFDVAQDTVRAILRGSLDVAFANLWEVMQADPAEETPAYLMVTNISYGSDGIVSQSALPSVEDLRGKKIGAKLGTVSHLILLEALNLHQVSPQDVEIVDVSNETAENMMRDGTLDAAVLWQPSLGEIAEAINGNIVFTTKDVDSYVIDGLVSRSSYISSHQEELTQFMLAWFDLMQAVETKPDEVFESVGRQLGQSPEAFASDFSGLLKGDIAMNEEMFKPQGRLETTKEDIVRLLQEDQRHGRAIRQDVEINSGPVDAAIAAWSNQ